MEFKKLNTYLTFEDCHIVQVKLYWRKQMLDIGTWLCI